MSLLYSVNVYVRIFGTPVCWCKHSEQLFAGVAMPRLRNAAAVYVFADTNFNQCLKLSWSVLETDET